MDTWLITTLSAVIAFLVIIIFFYLINWRYKNLFRRWQETEIIALEQERKNIRQSAITQSRAVLTGKFTEQMTPYLPEFKYDPTEARFVGSPIDMIVFPGLAQGDPTEVVIMEIKTGKHCQLTSAEKKIRQLIEDGMVRWELIEYNGKDDDEQIIED
ncbi:MAG: Holliday junction resolvase-like protein [Dehalococcoidales bacterium]|nr:Holliday junction resolvase-like protein [Dehalococcoidales bacterium]